MSLFSSSSKQTTTGTTSPTNPKPVTDSIIDFTKLIQSLGNRDPRQYVTGPSQLQNAAFSIGAGIADRYGARSQPQGQQGGSGIVGIGGGAYMPGGQGQPMVQAGPGGSTLYGSAGITPTTGGAGDFANYTPDPELKAGWTQVASRPQDQQFIKQSGGDYNNDGSISEQEYYNWHRSTFNDRGSYQPEVLNPQTGQPVQGGGGTPSLAAPGYGYEAANLPFNPVQQYQDASSMTRAAGMAGPNYGQASFAGQVDIDPVTNARATQGYKFADPYMNRYTDDVVNTTLANFDEYAGRQRAQEAAQAAGNNAFGGSRFGVQRAITEEQIARERASQEAGLRFSAQDKAFGFGMQDANSANQIAAQNAAAANARAESQAMLNMQRELANMAAANDMSRFNAGQGDTALARQLAAGGQLGALAGDMANNERADLTMLAQLGTDERNVQQQQATADLNLMQVMAQLYGSMPYGLFQGQNSTQTTTGTSSPSLASILSAGAMGLGSLGWSPLAGQSKSAVGA